MKGYNRWLANFRAFKPVYKQLYGLPVFNYTEGNGGRFVPQSREMTTWEMLKYKPPIYSDARWIEIMRTLLGVKENGHVSCLAALEAWLWEGLANQGPKVFVPTRQECDILANIEPTFTWEQFRQPFEVFGVVFPDGYFHNESPGPGESYSTITACMARVNRESRIVSIACVAGVEGNIGGLTSNYAWNDTDQKFVDQLLASRNYSDFYTEFESDASNKARRIYFNACQILTQCGMRKIGYSNHDYAEKLQAKLKKKHLSPQIQSLNRAELDSIPLVYGFDQHIRLYDTETVAPHRNEGEGLRVVHPHWRSGHWRNQPCGPRNELRKMIFVRPCFINPHLFAGEMFDTRVSMTASTGTLQPV